MTRRRPRSTLFPYTTLFRSRETIQRNAKQKIWVRREARPKCALRGVRNARKIRIQVKQIDDDLKMNVWYPSARSEEHTSELQSHHDLVCRLLLEKKKYKHHK